MGMPPENTVPAERIIFGGEGGGIGGIPVVFTKRTVLVSGVNRFIFNGVLLMSSYSR